MIDHIQFVAVIRYNTTINRFEGTTLVSITNSEIAAIRLVGWIDRSILIACIPRKFQKK